MSNVKLLIHVIVHFLLVLISFALKISVSCFHQGRGRLKTFVILLVISTFSEEMLAVVFSLFISFGAHGGAWRCLPHVPRWGDAPQGACQLRSVALRPVRIWAEGAGMPWSAGPGSSGALTPVNKQKCSAEGGERVRKTSRRITGRLRPRMLPVVQ